jgi:hypothetical protein
MVVGLTRRPQGDIQRPHYLRVAQPVIDVQALAAALHQTSVAQGAQLLGNVRLSLLQHHLQVTDTGFSTPAQRIQYAQSSRMGEQLAQLGHLVVSVSLPHL